MGLAVKFLTIIIANPFFFPTYAIIILNREGIHDWRREYEAKTNPSISALCVGACGMQQETGRGGDDPGAYNGSSDNGGTDDSCQGGARDVF